MVHTDSRHYFGSADRKAINGHYDVVLFVIKLKTRTVEIAGITNQPDGPGWRRSLGI